MDLIYLIVLFIYSGGGLLIIFYILNLLDEIFFFLHSLKPVCETSKFIFVITLYIKQGGSVKSLTLE